MHINSAEKKISTVLPAKSVVMWITPGVPFVGSTGILWPTETKQQGGPASFTNTMMLFFRFGT